MGAEEAERTSPPVPEAAEVEAVEPAQVLATPDITKAQIVASIPVIANLLAAFHVYTVTAQQQHALELAVGGSIGLFIADAVIRFGRSVNKAKG